MSVAKTETQKEANFANIRIIKARFAKDGQTFEDCIFNNDTMDIIIEDNRFPLRTKGLKKYDSADIDKIVNNANDFLNKHTEIDLHIAVNKNLPLDKHTEGSLMEKLHNPNINAEIPSKTQTLIIDGVNDCINDGVKKEELFDIEDKPIEKIIETDGVNEGTGDGVKVIPENIQKDIGKALENNFNTNESFEWTGETFTIGTNEKEVKLEDIVPPKEIIVEKVLTETGEINKNNRVYLPPETPKVIKNIEEIEKILIDPDTPSIEHMGLYEKLKIAEKHQNVIKKE
jgi:hypothetical protein